MSTAQPLPRPCLPVQPTHPVITASAGIDASGKPSAARPHQRLLRVGVPGHPTRSTPWPTWVRAIPTPPRRRSSVHLTAYAPARSPRPAAGYGSGGSWQTTST